MQLLPSWQTPLLSMMMLMASTLVLCQIRRWAVTAMGLAVCNRETVKQRQLQEMELEKMELHEVCS